MTDVSTMQVQTSFSPEDKRAIAIRDQTVLTGKNLRHATAAIRERLPADGDGCWGVSVQSPFLLLAILSALQAARGMAILLPHTRPELIEKLAGSCRGFITDTSMQLNSINLPELTELIREGSSCAAEQIDWHRPVGFMTSGSSGEPTSIFKSPAQLIAEIQILETAFGTDINSGRVFCGTTSHQHLFGFTFRVMWPFLTGRVFADTHIRIPGEIGAAARKYEEIVLISSPAFLERAQSLLDLEDLGRNGCIGFSSGSPLSPLTASHYNTIKDLSLIEIYGSTETGALAFRITNREAETPWQPLPGVSISLAEGRLNARGPHLPGEDSYTTEDIAELIEGGFLLKGRRDQIVKVADKRISLTELDRLLIDHSSVSEARVLQLTTGELAAVMVPTPDSWAKIKSIGKSEFCRNLRDHLAASVDRVTTPKRWRIVKRLPRNMQGKIELTALKSLFADVNTLPHWDVIESTATCWRGQIRINHDLDVLDGHFPGNPIVPGVAQVVWATRVARAAFGIPQVSGSMQAVKFKNPIFPITDLQLSLSLDAKRRSISFEFSDATSTYSSGRLVIHDG